MFSDQIITKLRETEADNVSVYDVFVRCAAEKLKDVPERRIDEVYRQIRNNGYIVHDEIELCVYVKKVAERHKEKFRALYKRLFDQRVLGRHASLVVWGCGCGLDILALYDRAISERDPELWLNIQNITLIDISPVALECARDLSVSLFPNANVKVVHADLKDTTRLGCLREKVLWVDAYLKCVHLLSNLLDLMTDEELTAFAYAVRDVSYRYRGDGQRLLLDDTYVAFSPNYNATNRKMDLFKAAFGVDGIVCSEIVNLSIQNCAYAWFTAVSNKSKECKLMFAPLRFFGDFRGELSSAMVDASAADKEELLNLSRDFTGFVKRFGAESLKDYTAVELRWTTGGKPYIVLYPSDGSDRKLLISFSSEDDGCKWDMIREWTKARMAPDKCEAFRRLYDALNPLGGSEQDARWRCSEFFRVIEAVRLSTTDGRWNNARRDVSEGDLSALLFYKENPDIPSLPALSAAQNAITVDRKRLRKIRGGPGTGKSVTMLWRAVKTVERTHLPVVILCKTNSLFSYSRQMLANTMLARFGVTKVRRDLVKFSTVAGFICDQVRDDAGLECGIRRGMSSGEMNRECSRCKGAWCRGGSSKLSTKYGGVYVDETQIQDPEEIAGVFNAATRKYSECDFYAFCDEQQTFRGSSVLEYGSDGDRNDRLVVKMPSKGFGRFLTLKTGFRFMKSPKIRELCAFVQSKMSAKYDVNELPILAARGESNLITRQLIIERRLAVGDSISGQAEPWMRAVFCGMANVPAKCALIFDSIEGAVNAGNAPDCGIPKAVLEACHFNDVWFTHNTQTEKDNELARRQRTKLYDRVGTFLCTTIDCAQGQTFANVILVISSAQEPDWETLFTGISRASERLLILDATPTGWVYGALQRRT